MVTRGLPCGPVVKNPPSNARDVGSIPSGGIKIPYAFLIFFSNTDIWTFQILELGIFVWYYKFKNVYYL